MKCNYGEWKCPYVEETSGCCVKEKCPEWQDYENIAYGIFECEKKSYEIWFEMERKIGEECAKFVKNMSDGNLPVAQLFYLDYK